MSNRCPHKAASLHKSGDIEDLGGDLGPSLRCPKHKKKFGGGLFVSFMNGRCATRSPCDRSDKVETWSVPVYETQELGGIVSLRRVAEHKRADPPVTLPTDEPPAELAAKVKQVRRVSPDSHVFTLKLRNKQDRAEFLHEYATMWHIWLNVGGVSREYTPISSLADTATSGVIDMVIKLYAQGDMSAQLAKLSVGDVVGVSTPRVTLQVPPLEEAPVPPGLSFNLLAGGTGIAPCLQLLRRARAAKASVRMLYSSWTHEHVLLAAELEDLAASWPDRGFRYTLVLTRAAQETEETSGEAERLPKRARTGAVVCGGHVDSTIVREHLGGQRDAAMTIVSGPPGFNACCGELVRCTLSPAEHGEVVVLDA